MGKKVSVIWLFLAIVVIFAEFFVIFNRHRFFYIKTDLGEIEQDFYRQNETLKDWVSMEYLYFNCNERGEYFASCGIAGPINKLTGEYVGGGPGVLVCKLVNNKWDCPLSGERRKEYILEAPEEMISQELKDFLY